MYVCMNIRCSLHCAGPGYRLLCPRIVPPPQSDHSKQLLSGESTYSIRHGKAHEEIIHASPFKVKLYIHMYA